MSAFIGAGIVSVAPWSDTTAFDSLTFVDVGNVSKLSPSFSEDRKTLKNYRNAAGGNYASFARVDSAELAMEWLGPRTELEIQQTLQREVEQERWTSLDRTLQREAGEDGRVQIERFNEPRLQRQRLLLIGAAVSAS